MKTKEFILKYFKTKPETKMIGGTVTKEIAKIYREYDERKRLKKRKNIWNL